MSRSSSNFNIDIICEKNLTLRKIETGSDCGLSIIFNFNIFVKLYKTIYMFHQILIQYSLGSNINLICDCPCHKKYGDKSICQKCIERHKGFPLLQYN